LILQLAELVADRLAGLDITSTIKTLGNGADLFQQRHLVGVEKLEFCGSAFGEVDDLAGEFDGTLSTLCPVVGHVPQGVITDRTRGGSEREGAAPPRSARRAPVQSRLSGFGSRAS
jgi:hypothetical protein